ncbi:unnamed protein product [Mytilus edulis]|uniref:CAP-Gly domain-containing protein n=1 Tax=Mytilus edulis TaxID=6550 RepID=A0A8S3TY48_MYTED|nr:unnamed protein product [Mytilus edulis]
MFAPRYRLSDVDPFMCTCGPCRSFWKDNFGEAAELLRESSLSRADDSTTIPHDQRGVKVGDRVLVRGQHAGTVKFVGVIDDNAIAPRLYVGVKLDDNINSTHNGVFKGKRYFYCERGHGAMVSRTVCQSRSGSPSDLMPTIARPKTEPNIHVGDPNDIVIKDLERQKERERRRREIMNEADQEKLELRKLRMQFGNNENADRMAITLRKLQRAYEEGLVISKRRGTRADLDYDSDED